MLKSAAKAIVYPVIDLYRVLSGALVFVTSGRTPERAYQSMIRLFCTTRGWSSDIMSSVLRLVRPSHDFPNASGVLGDLSAADLKKIAGSIREKGYHVFDAHLSDELCDRLLEYAMSVSCRVVPSDAQMASGKPAEAVVARYSRENPVGIRYDVPTQALLDNPTIQTFLKDLSILSVAQAYIGSRPILDIVTMWWNTAFGAGPSKQAAQFFHFDMDRLRWLKFFFYVTDVTEVSGPHCFVAKSHRRNGIPSELLKKGYARLTDEEVQKSYPDRKDFVVFTGRRGTIIAEDTRGLHKGRNVEKGDRLVFQLEFTNSLFGGAVETCNLDRVQDPVLKDMIRKYPRVYSTYAG